MNFRSTLVLALLVAALGAWLWRVERPKVEQESAKKTLLAFPRDRVTGIELAYPDVSITLRRNDGTWQVNIGGTIMGLRVQLSAPYDPKSERVRI